MALVANDATVDFMCLPDADSPTVFAALLDSHMGGHFSVEATDIPDGVNIRYRQNYLPNTNILISRLQGGGAIAEVRDFMLPTPLAKAEGVFVRQVSARHGQRSVRLACWPGFDYARAPHDATLSADRCTVVFNGGAAGRLRLSSTHPVYLSERQRGPEAFIEATLQPDSSVTVVLDWIDAATDPSKWPTLLLDRVDAWERATDAFWHEWIDASTYAGRWSEAVRRSALCLKLLQHYPTGGIVASPTFGLPEWPGAGRNWDYRYVWLRDAAFVNFALLRIGLVREAVMFAEWLTRRCAEVPPGSALHPVYRLDGSAPKREERLDHLAGYEGSRPIRIGNDAYHQVQLDVLGEVLDAMYLYDRSRAISWDLWRNLGVQLEWLANHWREPDSGMWEVRGPKQQFVSSKLLVWVAFERAGRLARRRGLPGDHETWEREADAAYRWVQDEGWDEEFQSYVQRAGSRDLDASTLLIPMLRFASGQDPRVLATLEKTKEHLSTDSLLYRYHNAAPQPDNNCTEPIDGIGGPEGTFTVCTFWYVENLVRAGRAQEAQLVFDKTLTYANEVGLFSEQIGPAGEALGNFPQALTHLALISAATTLDRALNSA